MCVEAVEADAVHAGRQVRFDEAGDEVELCRQGIGDVDLDGVVGGDIVVGVGRDSVDDGEEVTSRRIDGLDEALAVALVDHRRQGGSERFVPRHGDRAGRRHDGGSAPFATHRQRERGPDADGSQRLAGHRVQPSPEPAGGVILLARRLPDVHAMEVAAVEPGEADSVDDRQAAGVPEPLAARQRRVQPEPVAELMDGVGVERQLATQRPVALVADRHDGVQGVVTSVQREQNEGAGPGRDRGRRGGCGQRAGTKAAEGGDRAAGAEAEEVAAGQWHGGAPQATTNSGDTRARVNSE